MFSRLGRRLRKFLGDFWDVTVGRLFEFLVTRVPESLSQWDDSPFFRRMADRVVSALHRSLFTYHPRVAEEAREGLLQLSPLARIFLARTLWSDIHLSLFRSRLAGILAKIERDELAENTPIPPPVAEAVQAHLRGAVTLDELHNIMEQNGIHPYWSRILITAAKPKLSLNDIVEAHRRGILSESEAQNYAETAGFTKKEYDTAFALTRRHLTLAEIINAEYRGWISRADALARAAKIGVSEEDYRIAFNSAQTLLPAGEYITAWLRGLIDERELDQRLDELGFNETNIDLLKKLAFFIPPPTDLIRMAVREVFSPEVIQRFRMYEDFPEEFAEWAERQGISREWALAYWAAHWDLPSVGQAFEMFHREVINYDELVMLLRALDIMPYWRDKLLQIAYTPIGRIDILRMYQMGVIDRDEVERRYRHLGYSPEDAKIMADYTVKLATEREKDLSRTDIETLVEYGVISLEKAKEFLLRAGYTEEVTNLILARIEIKQGLRELEDEIEILKTQYLAGDITIQDVAVRLQQLGARGTLVDRVMAQLERERRKQRRTLTVAQIEKLVRRRKMTKEIAIDRLVQQGYTRDDAMMLTDLWLEEGTA